MIDLPEHHLSALHRLTQALDRIVSLDALVLGGGTVLAARWQHRVSTDLDLFVEQRTFAAHLLWPRASELFDVVDLGREHFGARRHGIDVTLSTAWCSALLDVQERSDEALAGIALETNEAILVRKMQARMCGLGMFTERDVYDLAAAAQHDPTALRTALSALTADERSYIARELRLSKQWDQPEKRLLSPTHGDIADNLRAAAVEVLALAMAEEAGTAPGGRDEG